MAAAAFAVPGTRVYMRWVLAEENGPVELLTFLFLFAGGVLGLSLAARARRLRLGWWTVAFYCAFGLGFLLVGMEEIAWGHWFFHWKTPAFWRELNRQGETTLHNISGIQGHTELFRIAFAAGGLIGIWCARLPSFAAVAAPAILAPLFLVIGVHSSIDLILDYAAPDSLLEKAFTRTSELVEMYVAFGGWAYLRLNSRRLAQLGARTSTAPVSDGARPSKRAGLG